MKRPHSYTHQVLCGDGLSRAAGPHHHARQSVFHVLQAVCQSQDGHDLAGHCNIKPSLEENHTQCKSQEKQHELFMQWPLELMDGKKKSNFVKYEKDKQKFSSFMAVTVGDHVMVGTYDAKHFPNKIN